MPKNNIMKPLNANKMDIFPTSIVTYVWEDSRKLNKELKKIILEKEKETTGVEQSNVGGFHSEANVFSWDCPEIKNLRTMINALAAQMANASGIKIGETFNISVAGWANIIRNGNYHMPHNHPNNVWSGVYYIDDGSPDKNIKYNGAFEFCDPRPAAEMLSMDILQGKRYQITPKPGLMIMFPSFVFHYVHPYVGDKERINIAFNIKIV